MKQTELKEECCENLGKSKLMVSSGVFGPSGFPRMELFPSFFGVFQKKEALGSKFINDFGKQR